MNKLIIFPVLIMIIFMFFSMLINLSDINSLTYSGNIEINGSGQTYGFAVTETQGFVAFIITAIAIGSVAGIRVLGSGLGNFSIQLITKGVFYLALWGILSTFAYTMLSMIWLVGAFIYLVLTVTYLIGFAQTLSSGGDDA